MNSKKVMYYISILFFNLSMVAIQVAKADTPEESKILASLYSGMWVTEDNYVRQELKPDGRYEEARGTREKAYIGRYKITGNKIQYWDDSGFTADGEFVNGVLYHGGMIMRRSKTEQ